MTKILITGHNGQLGQALQLSLAHLGEIVTLPREEFDLAQPGTIAKKVREVRPDIIVSAGAYTQVEQAETQPEIAMMVNGVAPGILAAEAKSLDALFIHYSTDYVFDGLSTTPYGEEAMTAPLSVYGKTKLEGENAVQDVGGRYLILRTNWVYSMHGKNFLLTMLRLGHEKPELKVVDDQIGTPNWTTTLAQATDQIITKCLYWEGKAPWGIYNLTSTGQTSWFGFAQEIFNKCIDLQLIVKAPKLIPISTAEYPTKAVRPHYSVLSTEKTHSTFGLLLSDWTEALESCLKEKKQ